MGFHFKDQVEATVSGLPQSPLKTLGFFVLSRARTSLWAMIFDLLLKTAALRGCRAAAVWPNF